MILELVVGNQLYLNYYGIFMAHNVNINQIFKFTIL